MTTAHIVNFLVDLVPFVVYIGVVIKIFRSWKLIKADADEARKSRLAAVLILLAVVIAVLLASNVYALAIYGKTYMSVPVFQAFLIGNCVVYWVLLDLITKDSLHAAQGKPSESSS